MLYGIRNEEKRIEESFYTCPFPHTVILRKVMYMNYYDRSEKITTTPKEHNIQINNRKEIEINGVKDIDSFDNEEFLIETVMGYLIIRGQNLQLKNLNVDEGLVQIKGKLYEMTYVDDQQTGRAKGLFSKLFK